jgi:hypothetical protein
MREENPPKGIPILIWPITVYHPKLSTLILEPKTLYIYLLKENKKFVSGNLFSILLLNPLSSHLHIGLEKTQPFINFSRESINFVYSPIVFCNNMIFGVCICSNLTRASLLEGSLAHLAHFATAVSTLMRHYVVDIATNLESLKCRFR